MMFTEQLKQALPDLQRKLALGARYALDKPTRIALGTLRANAQACGVSGPTLLR
ncbi:hypothetical protein [Roseovarius sp. Pro17]|uniref:hypothetical protein n=1 Tax=Roseovarius sp. Pro17 TaxID=3108175 RepID=UPI002D79F0A6|nr:hypothetical protein [Roseovarius sp. Pro17]